MPNSSRPALSPRRVATRRLFLRLTGMVLGVGAATAVDARYIEPNAVEVTHHNVFLPDLPDELEGMTVAQLTDLHRGPNTPDATIRQAVAATVALKPDLVVLTGDFVDHDPKDALPLVEMLKPLEARLGVWGCLGNHDYRNADKVVEHLTAQNTVKMLRNANQQVAPGLWIAGIEDTVNGHPDTAKAMDGIPSDVATIFLTHNPVGVWSCSDRPHLVLSGHTHGGQILIPGMAPRFPPGMAGFPLIAGWGVFDQARLYVSRGVGMSMLPLRLRCRPEVACFTLHRGTLPPQAVPSAAGQMVGKAERVLRKAAHHL
jgi:predicted MPP superfamily phosphohydrolase